MNNVHEIWKVTESFCDDYCNGAEGMHICFSSEDFENWKGFDMWEVDENLQTGETMYKCLDCNFKIETKEKMKAHFKIEHESNMEAICFHCEYRYMSWKGLRRHFKINHMKPYPSY